MRAAVSPGDTFAGYRVESGHVSPGVPRPAWTRGATVDRVVEVPPGLSD